MKANYLFFALFISVAIMLVGCKSSKSVAKSFDEEEISVPFSDFKTDKNYFRAVGSGVSPDMNVAKKVALQNAKSEIAGSIQSIFKEVISDYAVQHGINATPDLAQKFEGMSVNAVNQVLSNLVVKDQKFLRSKKTSDIRSFVAVEMSKEDVGKSVASRISQEAKDKIDFDEYQFRKIFDKVMKDSEK